MTRSQPQKMLNPLFAASLRLTLTIAVFLIAWLSLSAAATAATCRDWGDHQICIISVQRSAKYFWEYRAAVTIDGRDRPVEKYNCRDRQRVRRDGSQVPFEPQGAGELICQLVHPPQHR